MSKAAKTSTTPLLPIIAMTVVGFIIGSIAGAYGALTHVIQPSWLGLAKYKLALPDTARYATIENGTDAAGNYRLGAANAPLVLTEYSDFQCPFCERMFGAAYGDIVKNYIATGKAQLVFRHFPLSFHPQAEKAAEATECAGQQNAFWPMHDAIFLNQTAWSNNPEAVAMFKDLAHQLDLDTSTFNTCLDSNATKGKIEGDLAAGVAAGVSGTPTIFIHDLAVSGALPFAAFSEIIEATLAKDEAKLKTIREVLKRQSEQ